MLKDSIDNGPYQLKSEITVNDTDGVTEIRLPQRLKDIVREDKLRYDSDIKSINILLLGLLVDIYTLINHYQTAKEIWDRIKELMEGAEMTKQEHHVDTYDSDCDDEASANAIFMANLSPVGSLNDDTIKPCYDSDIHSEVPHYDTYHDSDMLKSNIQELGYIKNIVSNNESYDECKGNNKVISYTDYMLTIGIDEDNYVPPLIQKSDMMLSIIEQIKSQVEKCNMVNQESKSIDESLTSDLEQYKDRVRLLEYAVKDGHSEQEAYISRELYSAINDHNRKVADFEKQVFSQQTQMKDLNNHIAFLNKNFEILKKSHLKGRESSTNASESKPKGNTKNDRIP
uniref:Uncharacterized protein n=1 Tax=Tanacetum cinerariifolium TaxID=118510 RepID=A0A699H004_TANCI|nr:hypothetical protein [Tanacetum cinerariifolium]